MSNNNNNNATSMGDLFRQRRAAAAASAAATPPATVQVTAEAAASAKSAKPTTTPTKPTAAAASTAVALNQTKKSFVEIQKEQEMQSMARTTGGKQQPTRTKQLPQKRDGNQQPAATAARVQPSSDRSPRGEYPPQQRTATTTTSGSKRSSNKGKNTVISSYPIEQGCICSLKDSFGFIYCADRDDQVFFHYSELLGNNVTAESIRMDEEVEFRIGPSPRDAEKMAAYQVRVLPHGTVQWEVPEYKGQRVRGRVERRVAAGTTTTTGNNSRNSSNNDLSTSSSGPEGTIRLLKEKDNDKDEEEVVTTTTTADGPLTRFSAGDYKIAADQQQQQQRRIGALSRGDLVECRIVREKRTGFLYARDITLLLSERDRVKQEAERRLLESAVVEHGVVTALKGEYGFLKSSARREEVYFHYSSIHMDESEDGSDQLVLQEGQDMKFLVVEEDGDGEGRPRRRISARSVRMQPRGSVVFHDVICRGVTGTVVQVPQCVDSSHLLEQHGKVRLDQPVTARRYTGGQPEPGETAVTEVYLATNDSPGGKFCFRGGSSVGLWIQEGDKLLFDIVQDYSDGACRAVPTTYLTPAKQQNDAPPLKAETESEENAPIAASAAATLDDDDDDGVVRAVRLIDLTLAGRAEGVIGALKEAYGFIQFAERPVDVHFKMYQILPNELQIDLRRNMGMSSVDDEGQPLKLEVGVQVQFDISVHGTIHSSNAGGGGGGRSRGRQQQQQSVHERENLKAQRVLFLPPTTFTHFTTLASGVKGVICKLEATQPYVGNVELDVPVKPMSMERRHPLVAKMIETYLQQAMAVRGDVPPLVYHDIQSSKEDEVVIKLLETIGKGKLAYSHIPQAGETNYPGRLCIRKAADQSGENADGVDTEAIVGNEDEKVDGSEEAKTSEAAEGDETDKDNTKGASRKKKSFKQKPIKSIRYDRHSLGDDLIQDAPPGIGDVVECDVVQCRRSGQLHIESMRVVERHVTEVTMSETPAIGIVKEVVPARNFGFISVIDETASSSEMIFFHLKNASDGDDENTNENKTPKFRQGDAVKFDIGTEKNGKRVAMNVTVLPKGALPSKADKNACLGLVLSQPSHTFAKNTPVRKATSGSLHSRENTGRWATIDEDRKKPASEDSKKELGCILLTQDPFDMFSRKPSDESAVEEGEDEPKKDTSEQPKKHSAVHSHLRYKNGALAIHGTGSSSVGDESTNPRRGDLVSFVKAKNGSDIRDVRIVSRGAATLIRGRLEEIYLEDDGTDGSEIKGRAKFVAEKDESMTFDVNLSEIVSCDPSILKDKEAVEGILHENQIYGIARTADLYFESKLGVGHKERPKLNLTVKKDRGGKIVAQSMMAKGPDGTSGFVAGWTTRTSRFAVAETAVTTASPELKVDAEEFTPGAALISEN